MVEVSVGKQRRHKEERREGKRREGRRRKEQMRREDEVLDEQVEEEDEGLTYLTRKRPHTERQGKWLSSLLKLEIMAPRKYCQCIRDEVLCP